MKLKKGACGEEEWWVYNCLGKPSFSVVCEKMIFVKGSM